MSVNELETAESFEQTIAAGGKVVVDFWASWCGPCRMMKPVLEQLADEHPQVKVASINVDDVPQPAMQYQIDSIPAFILFENGQPVKKAVGAMPLASLVQNLGL